MGRDNSTTEERAQADTAVHAGWGALLPCPFCGGAPKLCHGAPGCWYVGCMWCRVTTDDVSQTRAIELWNRRDEGAAAQRSNNNGAREAQLEAIVRSLTKCLTGLTPGGSEYFRRLGDLHYADTEACERVIRERFARGHKGIVEAVKLQKALRLCLTGGNHLACHIGDDHPPHTADPHAALEHYGPGIRNDLWQCWRNLSLARDMMEELNGQRDNKHQHRTVALSGAADAAISEAEQEYPHRPEEPEAAASNRASLPLKADSPALRAALGDAIEFVEQELAVRRSGFAGYDDPYIARPLALIDKCRAARAALAEAPSGLPSIEEVRIEVRELDAGVWLATSPDLIGLYVYENDRSRIDAAVDTTLREMSFASGNQYIRAALQGGRG